MAVIEQIANDSTTVGFRQLHVWAGLSGDVFECHLAEVAENGVWLTVSTVGKFGDVIENVPASDEQIL